MGERAQEWDITRLIASAFSPAPAAGITRLLLGIPAVRWCVGFGASFMNGHKSLAQRGDRHSHLDSRHVDCVVNIGSRQLVSEGEARLAI
jgi:hypothetical protein